MYIYSLLTYVYKSFTLKLLLQALDPGFHFSLGHEGGGRIARKMWWDLSRKL
jgi:hypothetical protein